MREDTLQLFGFAGSAEREIFEQLLGVSGSARGGALRSSRGMPPIRFAGPLRSATHALFTSITGIGKKTAERLVIDLKDKVGSVALNDAVLPAASDDHTQARDALVGLGMSVAEAEAALKSVDAELPVSERVRAALRQGRR